MANEYRTVFCKPIPMLKRGDLCTVRLHRELSQHRKPPIAMTLLLFTDGSNDERDAVKAESLQATACYTCLLRRVLPI